MHTHDSITHASIYEHTYWHYTCEYTGIAHAKLQMADCSAYVSVYQPVYHHLCVYYIPCITPCITRRVLHCVLHTLYVRYCLWCSCGAYSWDGLESGWWWGCSHVEMLLNCLVLSYKYHVLVTALNNASFTHSYLIPLNVFWLYFFTFLPTNPVPAQTCGVHQSPME